MALRVGLFIASIVAPFVFYFVDLRFGKFNVFLAAALFFAVALALAILWERRKRRLRRQKGVAERVG